MYQELFGLTYDPFRLVPDGTQTFHHRSYAKALAYLRFALFRGEGLHLVHGESGTGKSTLIDELCCDVDTDAMQVLSLSCTPLSARQVPGWLAAHLGAETATSGMAQSLVWLHKFAALRRDDSRRVVVILDDVDVLSDRALRELLRYSSTSSLSGAGLQMILVANSSLRVRLDAPDNADILRRFAACSELVPLAFEEMSDYFSTLWERASEGRNQPLDAELLSVLFNESGGLPSKINLLCSRLLLHGYVERRRTLSMSDLRQVLSELETEGLMGITGKADSICTEH